MLFLFVLRREKEEGKGCNGRGEQDGSGREEMKMQKMEEKEAALRRERKKKRRGNKKKYVSGFISSRFRDTEM